MANSLLKITTFLALLFSVVACDQNGATVSKSVAVSDGPKQAATLSTETITKLAKADLVDGTEDKIVHKCGGCALGMNGSEDHKMKAGEYEMHFCSSYCLDVFEKDVNSAVAQMTMPEEAE